MTTTRGDNTQDATFESAAEHQRRRARSIATGFSALSAGWTFLLICLVSNDIVEPDPLPELLLIITGAIAAGVALAIAIVFRRARRSPRGIFRIHLAAAMQTGHLPPDANPDQWGPPLQQAANPDRRTRILLGSSILLGVLPVTQVLTQHSIYATTYYASYLAVWVIAAAVIAARLPNNRRQARALLHKLEGGPGTHHDADQNR